MSDIDDLLRKASDMRIDSSPCPGPSFSTDELRAARLELAQLRRAKDMLGRIFAQECALLEVGSKPRLSSAEILAARAILAEIDGKESTDGK